MTGASPRTIALITKLETTNLGNEALSSELIRMSDDHSPQWQTLVLGRPRGLERFRSLDELPDAPDRAVAWFDDQVDALLRAYRLHRPWAQVARHLPTASPREPRVLVPGKRDLRTRGRLLASKLSSGRAWPRPASAPYFRRLAILESVDAVAYSGAGEVVDQPVLLRQLLELGAVANMGKPLFPVNQSVEVRDPRLLAILVHVYRRARRIVVRGNASRRLLIESGIDESMVGLAPDTAFHAAVPRAARATPTRRAAIAVNGVFGADLDGWTAVAAHLASRGYRVSFVSNDPWYDLEIAQQLRERVALTIEPPISNYGRYIDSLADFDLVVSNRLHTAVFAMLAGVPVVPVEGNVGKTTDIFGTFGYPLPVTQTAPGWERDACAAVDRAEDEAEALRALIPSRCAELRDRSRENVAWAGA